MPCPPGRLCSTSFLRRTNASSASHSFDSARTKLLSPVTNCRARHHLPREQRLCGLGHCRFWAFLGLPGGRGGGYMVLAVDLLLFMRCSNFYNCCPRCSPLPAKLLHTFMSACGCRRRDCTHGSLASPTTPSTPSSFLTTCRWVQVWGGKGGVLVQEDTASSLCMLASDAGLMHWWRLLLNKFSENRSVTGC
jgi:hypothetical protein